VAENIPGNGLAGARSSEEMVAWKFYSLES
jgi:hypothetical protein